jgi:plastocyanin
MTIRAFVTLAGLFVFIGTGAVRAASVSIEARAAPYVFAPDSRTISVGDTVVWQMVGEPHTVTSGTIDASNVGHPDGRFDSGTRLAGDQYNLTFTEPGTFPYFCIVHADSRMAGTIVVTAASTPAPTAPPTPAPTAPPTPAPTARPTAAPTAPRTAAPTSTATPAPSPTSTAAPTATATPTATPTATASPTASPSAVPSPSDNPTAPASADVPPLVLGGLVAVVVLGAAGAAYVVRRRGGT